MLARLLFICIVMASCAGPGMIETSLYFAQMKPNGDRITEQEWQQFKNTHIARIYQEGSTTISVTGNWYDPDAHKLITEPTYVVIYYHKRSAKKSDQIDSLRNLYVRMFQQQSVLRVDKKVKATF